MEEEKDRTSSSRASGAIIGDDRLSAANQFKIFVSHPKKEAEKHGSGFFISFLITTLVGDGGYWQIFTRRRFKDVVALADRIAEPYRGYFIPHHPEKRVVESLMMDSESFRELRQSDIEKYLRRLVAHPVIGNSNELKSFLGFSETLPRVVNTEATAKGIGQSATGRIGLESKFRELMMSMPIAKPSVEEDEEFLKKQEKLQKLESELTTSAEKAETYVAAEFDLGVALDEMALAFSKLANFESVCVTYPSDKTRADDIKQFSTALQDASRFYKELNEQTDEHLDTLRNYLDFMLAARNAFTDRSSALLKVQKLTSELSALQARKEKMEPSSSETHRERSKLQKLEELKETIRKTESTRVSAIEEYERIKERNASEFERLERAKRGDFLVALKEFASNQVSHAEKCATLWEELAEYLKWD